MRAWSCGELREDGRACGPGLGGRRRALLLLLLALLSLPVARTLGEAREPAIEFHGAAGELSGSLHLLDTGTARILLDCGVFMDGKRDAERNRELPAAAPKADALVLSHAHLDHSGRIPLLFEKGFHGPVYCARPTRELTGIMLELQAWLRGWSGRWIPTALDRFVELPYGAPRALPGAAELVLHPAEHILGAAMVEIRFGPPDRRRVLLYTGDFGNAENAIVLPKGAPPAADYLVVESTYGDRTRAEGVDLERFYALLRETVRDNGVTIVPSFVLARTQKVLALIHRGMEQGRAPRSLNVYVDSLTATRITRIYARHQELLRPELRGSPARSGPFTFSRLRYYRTFTEIRRPAVVIAPTADGAAARARHYIERYIGDPTARICFVSSYQAPGTIGDLLTKGARQVRIGGRRREVRAKIYELAGFSGHGDRRQLLEWMKGLSRVQRVFVVHGEPEASRSLAAEIERRFGWPVTVPGPGMRFPLP
jgi:metallo-beta-lactamase family protein